MADITDEKFEREQSRCNQDVLNELKARYPVEAGGLYESRGMYKEAILCYCMDLDSISFNKVIRAFELAKQHNLKKEAQGILKMLKKDLKISREQLNRDNEAIEFAQKYPDAYGDRTDGPGGMGWAINYSNTVKAVDRLEKLIPHFEREIIKMNAESINS